MTDIESLEKYLDQSIEDAVECFTSNLNKGFLMEAYGWECRLVGLSSMAHDFHYGDLEKKADNLRKELRDKREEAQRKVANA